MAIVCKTCGEPYKKVRTRDDISFCSSTFHCCKDCKWECETVGGFCAMKLTESCKECKEVFEEHTGA
jgi:hypothetical protein